MTELVINVLLEIETDSSLISIKQGEKAHALAVLMIISLKPFFHSTVAQ